MLVVAVDFFRALFKYIYNRMYVRSFCTNYTLLLYRIDTVVVQSTVFSDSWDCSN